LDNITQGDMTMYYYSANDQQQGPVSEDELVGLIKRGAVRGSTLIWKEGMPEWAALSESAPHLLTSAGAAASSGLSLASPPVAPASAEQAVCAVSGRMMPKAEMVRFGDIYVAPEHRDTYLQRMREGATEHTALKYGSIGSRFVAQIIDGILMYVVQSAVNVAMMGSMTQTVDPEDPLAAFGAMFFVAMLVNLLIGAAYEAIMVAKKGATLGKMALGLKVVRPDGSPVSMGQAIGRHFARIPSSMILMIGYLMAFWDDERRSLHDRMAGTRVITTR
jgi:uncharacterized RDD family membrane protein YckC